MRRLVGPPNSVAREESILLQQRRPRGVGGVARCAHRLLVAPRHVHRIERRPPVAARIPEEHQYAAVWRPGRPLIVIAFREDALAGTICAHDADGKLARRLFGESDVIAARGPHGRRISAVAEADTL